MITTVEELLQLASVRAGHSHRRHLEAFCLRWYGPEAQGMTISGQVTSDYDDERSYLGETFSLVVVNADGETLSPTVPEGESQGKDPFELKDNYEFGEGWELFVAETAQLPDNVSWHWGARAETMRELLGQQTVAPVPGWHPRL